MLIAYSTVLQTILLKQIFGNNKLLIRNGRRVLQGEGTWQCRYIHIVCPNLFFFYMAILAFFLFQEFFNEP